MANHHPLETQSGEEASLNDNLRISCLDKRVKPPPLSMETELPVSFGSSRKSNDQHVHRIMSPPTVKWGTTTAFLELTCKRKKIRLRRSTIKDSQEIRSLNSSSDGK